MVGEERNENEREREKISKKESQSHFHCLVEQRIYRSPFIFVVELLKFFIFVVELLKFTIVNQPI